MDTPALGRRVVVAGAAVVALLALCLDLLLYVSTRSTLWADLDRDLDQAADLARLEARLVGTGRLPERLAPLDVEATVLGRAGGAGPAPRVAGTAGVVERRIRLDDGSVVRLTASRADADRTLGRLLWLEALVTPLVVLLAVLLLRFIAEFALRPLDRIAAAARRTAEGHRGERLRPRPADTELGQMAAAYDEMLDALETAVHDAEAANAEAGRLLERNRRIIETAHEAFVAVDEAGTIVDWNAEAERIFGWTTTEALGRPVAGTVIPPAPEGEDDRGLGRFRGPAAPERKDRVVPFTALHRDGHEFAARMTVWSTTHGGTETVSAFVWDVTDQLRAEQAVAHLGAVVEAADDAMLSTTVDGVVLTWNAAAERLFGYRADEAIGRQVDLIVPEPMREENRRAGEAVHAGAAVQRFQSVRRCKNGTLVETAVTMSPIRDAAGTVYAVATTARDITEDRWIAAQLDLSLRALEDALEEAQTSERDTRRFLDDAAHQIRAPLTSIRACAEGLLLTTDPGDREELLAAVVREAARAGRLMSSLLRLARLDHGQKLQSAPCDLAAICRAEADRMRPLAPHLEIEVGESQEDPPGRPAADPQAVAEVVSNLLDNARRHARSRIDVVVRRDVAWAEVRVGDDGPGLPESAVDSAFERFVSLDGKGGSGLGLPIARELARAHDGDLVYRDGSFVLRLPASVAGTGVPAGLSRAPVARAGPRAPERARPKPGPLGARSPRTGP